MPRQVNSWMSEEMGWVWKTKRAPFLLQIKAKKREKKKKTDNFCTWPSVVNVGLARKGESSFPRTFCLQQLSGG